MSGRGDWSEREAAKAQALVVVQPPRLPMPPEAEQQKITLTQWRSLVDAIFPSAKSVGGVMLAIDYCKARGLDVFKRPVHVVPMYNSALGREVETVWPGIGELRTTASRTGVWAGNDDIVFGRMLRQAFRDSRTFNGRNGQEPRSTSASCPEMDFPEWAQMTVYKIVAGVRVPFVGPKVFFMETFSGEKGLRVPNTRWRQAPRQMLEKCAEAAALRRAFPEELQGDLTAEEMEGQVIPVGGAEIPQAVYHQAGGETGGSEQVEQPEQEQQDEQQQEPQRELNGWHEERLDRYMASMRKFISMAQSLDVLDEAMEKERAAMATLPPAEKNEADGLIATARGALAGPTEQREPADNGEPQFIVELRGKVLACAHEGQLTEVERAETAAIERQEAWIASVARKVISNRRDALRKAG